MLNSYNNDKVDELNKKYDEIIKAQLSVKYWPYWILSSIGVFIILYVSGEHNKNSMLIGAIVGMIIAFFWQSYIKTFRKKSQAYLDLQKQKAYAVKALKNSLLPEYHIDGKADFNPVTIINNSFQTPSPNNPQKAGIPGKYWPKKTQNNKWMVPLYTGIVLCVLVIIGTNINTISNFIKSYITAPVTSDHTAEKSDNHLIIKTKSANKKNTSAYKSDKNLRHCLGLPTKEQVILCSEQAE